MSDFEYPPYDYPVDPEDYDDPSSGESDDSGSWMSSLGWFFSTLLTWVWGAVSWTFGSMGSLVPDFSWITGPYAVGFWLFSSFFGVTLLFTLCMFCSYKAILDMLNTVTCGLFSTLRTIVKFVCSCIF